MEIAAAASAIDFLIFDEEDEDDDIIMLEMIQIQAVYIVIYILTTGT